MFFLIFDFFRQQLCGYDNDSRCWRVRIGHLGRGSAYCLEEEEWQPSTS